MPEEASLGNMRTIKIIVEKHVDGYVAYPLGMQGVIVDQGDSYEEVLSNVKSAISLYLEVCGPNPFETDYPVLEAFVAEIRIEEKES